MRHPGSSLRGGEHTSSPFFNRSYGGFTEAQATFLREISPPHPELRMLDPMAGQGYTVATWAHSGAKVTIADLNPAPLLLSVLRDPKIIGNRQQLLHRAHEVLESGTGSRKAGSSTEISESWLPPDVSAQITRLGAAVGITKPKDIEDALREDDMVRRFLLASLVLAARRLTCFRPSDNLTWLKPGGLVRAWNVSAAISQELSYWSDWADEAERVMTPRQGSLRAYLQDARLVGEWLREEMDVVVTSPPYANRLDYTRMWGPELAVLEAIANVSVGVIRSAQIGSNVVANRWEERTRVLPRLPRAVDHALHQIRDDQAPYSDSYYYPFFKNYANSLTESLEAMVSATRRGGKLVIFVRDTVRKDVLFPTGDLVAATLIRRLGCSLIKARHRVIRSHVGFRRKRYASSGLHGLAQREAWLAFRRGTK